MRRRLLPFFGMKTQNPPPLSWADVAPRLVAVAAGRAPADLVIRGGQWVNVHTREVLPGHDVAIAEGRFAAIAPDLSYAIGPDTQVIEAKGRYMVPGLCDGHMHVESGMLTPAEFAAAVIPRMARRPCSPTPTRSPMSWASRASG